jgi:hypothetical protein
MMIKESIIMKNQILSRVEDRIKKYQADHGGEKPLYIIMADDEAENLMKEVKQKEGHDPQIIVTEYKGSKIVKNLGAKAGEILLSNELPETGS